MLGVEEIKAAIEALPEDEFRQLRQWFMEKEWQKWDEQITKDSKAGKNVY